MYAEMGGQVADHGKIVSGNNVFEVNNVQKNKGGKYMHYGVVKSGTFSVGDSVTASYCKTRRQAIGRAHSATHLLHKALREVLGDHVHQAGSLVEPDFLRFDFTHFSAVTPEQLRQVEEIVNNAILTGYGIDVKEMSLDEARKTGATALFGEKYGNVVRVVNMGDWSVELCGGTHLDNTAKAGAFHIISEGSVASGVRRIEASTGLETMKILNHDLEELSQLAAMYKTSPADLPQKLEQQAVELREAKRLIEQYKAKESAGGADEMLKNGKDVKGLRVVTCSREGCDANTLRQLGDVLRDKCSNVVAVVASVNGDKITFQCVCGKDAVAKGVKAGDIIRNITAIAGGKGGGKPDSAMGGGNDVSKLNDALNAVEGFVNDKI
jgi:alanyl-tRNA synthetase